MKDLWDKQVKLHYERIHDRYAKINHLAYLRNFPQIYSVNDILRNIINNTLAETAFINQTRIENLLDEPWRINIDVSSPEFMIFWWGCVGGLFFCLTFINTFCDDYGAKEDEKKRKLDKKKKLQELINAFGEEKRASAEQIIQRKARRAKSDSRRERLEAGEDEEESLSKSSSGDSDDDSDSGSSDEESKSGGSDDSGSAS